MPSQADVQAIDKEGKVSKKRRFDARDWEFIAEYVISEWELRKRKRSDREKHWKEIDRQIAMIPDVEFKKLPNGKIDSRKRWMSEVELPLQAQALEINTADSRRFMFPGNAPWFRAHAETTDEYFERVDFQSLILGDKSEVPSITNQDNADKLVEGFLLHQHRQNDLFSRMDRINAEVFKYGMGVGRARMETKNIYIHESRGVRKEKQKIPVLVPCSIKHLYLDEPMPSMHSSQVLGPAHIAEDWIKLENLQIAANRGSTDPDDEDGGWMAGNMKGLEPDKDGFVQILEIEGDLVIPRKTVRSIVIPGAIATVVKGSADKGGNVTKSVIRFRFRKPAYSSYLLFPYHYEGADDAYPTSPLEKGRPVQIMATDALNRLLDSAMLKIAPPVGYDRTDMAFANTGGPTIAPYETWGTTDPVTVHDKIGGDPSALAQSLRLGINLYAELTGILPARVGAQTVSHMAYEMGRSALGRNEKVSFFIDTYGGFVEVVKDQLPERAAFEWFGSGGPADEQRKSQTKLQALQLAIQMDQLKVQAGGQPSVDIDAAIKQTLRDGGWTDIDVITQQEAEIAPQEQNPGAATVALQQLGLAAE